MKPYRIYITCIGGWWSAICPQLVVSGFGPSRAEAIEAVIVSMRSTLSLMLKVLERDHKEIVQLVKAQ